MNKLTAIQLKIIETMLHTEILQTSNFVKLSIENEKITKGWIWQNIYKLEDLGLIERVNSSQNQKTRIKHKKLFDEALLKDEYNVVFVNVDIDTENIKKDGK